MKILEQYVLNFFGHIVTIRLYDNGQKRCSCQHFHNAFTECYHVKNIEKGSLVEARRTQ